MGSPRRQSPRSPQDDRALSGDDFEVAIEAEHFATRVLGAGDYGCIDQSERQIRVAGHQLADSRETGLSTVEGPAPRLQVVGDRGGDLDGEPMIEK